MSTRRRARLALAGQGLRDVTRIAAPGAGMWLQILTANAGPAGAVLSEVAADLAQAAAALESLAAGDEEAAKQLADLLDRGIGGVAPDPRQARRPGRGTSPRCRSSSRTGQASWPGCSSAAGEAGINIEDVSIEHSPGLPVGVAELWVRPEAVSRLSGVLAAGGWPVRR